MQVLLIFAVILLANVVKAEVAELNGTDVIPFVPANEWAETYRDDFPWQFVGCTVVIDLTAAGEPVIGSAPVYDLVFEDDPRLDTYQKNSVGNAKVFIRDQWIQMDKIDFSELCPFPVPSS